MADKRHWLSGVPWFIVVLLAAWGCITGFAAARHGRNFVMGFLGGIAWPIGLTIEALAFIFGAAGIAKLLSKRFGRGADWFNAGAAIGGVAFLLLVYPFTLLVFRVLRHFGV